MRYDLSASRPKSFQAENCISPVSSHSIPEYTVLVSPDFVCISLFVTERIRAMTVTFPEPSLISLIFSSDDGLCFVGTLSMVSSLSSIEPLLPMLICRLSFQVLV